MPPKSKLALQQKKPRLKRTAHLSAGGKDVVVLKEVKIKEQQEENVCKLTSEGVSSTAEVISWKTSDVTAETCVVAEHVHVGGDTTQDACEKRLPDEIKDTRDVVYDCDQCGPNTLSCESLPNLCQHSCGPSKCTTLETQSEDCEADMSDFQSEEKSLAVPQPLQLRFPPQVGNGRKRKAPKKEALTKMEMDELQLAIALSASEAPDGLGEIELEQRGSKKRKRCTKPQQEPALTNLTSSQIQQKIMNRLECVFGDNSCEAQQTPDLPASKLTGRFSKKSDQPATMSPQCLFGPDPTAMREGGPGPTAVEEGDNSKESAILPSSPSTVDEDRLWMLAAYKEKDKHELFYVQSLQPLIASTLSKSSQENTAPCLHEVEELERARNVELYANPMSPENRPWVLESVGVQTDLDCPMTHCGSQLHTDVASLLDSPFLADTSVLLGDGTQLSAHAVILSARWPLFKNILSKELSSGTLKFISLDLSEYDPHLVRLLMKHTYTGTSGSAENDVLVCAFLDTVTSLKITLNSSAQMSAQSGATCVEDSPGVSELSERRDSTPCQHSPIVRTPSEQHGDSPCRDSNIEQESSGTETAEHFVTKKEHCHSESSTSASLFSPSSDVILTKEESNEHTQADTKCVSSLKMSVHMLEVSEDGKGVAVYTEYDGVISDVGDTSSEGSTQSLDDSDLCSAGSGDELFGDAGLFDLDCPQVEMLFSPLHFTSGRRSSQTETPRMGAPLAPPLCTPFLLPQHTPLETARDVGAVKQPSTMGPSPLATPAVTPQLDVPPPWPRSSGSPTSVSISPSISLSSTPLNSLCPLTSLSDCLATTLTSPSPPFALSHVPLATLRSSPPTTMSGSPFTTLSSASLSIVDWQTSTNIVGYPSDTPTHHTPWSSALRGPHSSKFSSDVAPPIINTIHRLHLTPAGCVSGPVTPMPNYIEMATPWLKAQLSKFGVRPLSKKKMIAKLIEIYEYLHPIVQECGKPTESLKHCADGRQQNPRDGDSKTRTFTSIEPCLCQETCKEEPKDVETRISNFISSHRDLYEDVVTYKTIDLVEFHGRLKEDGIKVSRPKLMDFLDKQNITFTLPRTRR